MSFERWEVREMAIKEMQKWLDDSWSFAFNNRKRVIGICYHGSQRIEISTRWIKVLTFEELMDTIRHEIAHALAGYKAGHGPAWKQQCRIVGANPTRLANPEKHVQHTWELRHKVSGEVFQRLYRKPSAKRIQQVSNFWINGRMSDTRGQLEYVKAH